MNNATSVTLGQNDHFEDGRTLDYEENSIYKIGLQMYMVVRCTNGNESDTMNN